MLARIAVLTVLACAPAARATQVPVRTIFTEIRSPLSAATGGPQLRVDILNDGRFFVRSSFVLPGGAELKHTPEQDPREFTGRITPSQVLQLRDAIAKTDWKNDTPLACPSIANLKLEVRAGGTKRDYSMPCAILASSTVNNLRAVAHRLLSHGAPRWGQVATFGRVTAPLRSDELLRIDEGPGRALQRPTRTRLRCFAAGRCVANNGQRRVISKLTAPNLERLNGLIKRARLTNRPHTGPAPLSRAAEADDDVALG